MEQPEFNGLFKDLITHLYDYTVLETHPLTSVIRPPVGYQGSRGEHLRQLILEEIERFKPPGEESLHSVEWRPYHILYKRFVEGVSLRDLSQVLSLSERQLRRDTSRALQALTGRIWDKLLAEGSGSPPEGEQAEDRFYESNLEVLNLNDIIRQMEAMLQKRVAVDGFELVLQLRDSPILVMSDRIVMRQILISLVGYFLNFPCDRELLVSTSTEGQQACITLQSKLVETWSQEEEEDHTDLLESAQYWSGQLNGKIDIHHPPEGELGIVELIFHLPLGQQNIILVVDDQKPTQQMFERFLSRTSYHVMGTTDPSEAISLAHQLNPILITLDVMMPKVDGWEILQALKSNLHTKDIPILVCSAWEEPELAHSLGAAGFLKKPVRQRDLLEALDRLSL